jgi:hypothetical protein
MPAPSHILRARSTDAAICLDKSKDAAVPACLDKSLSCAVLRVPRCVCHASVEDVRMKANGRPVTVCLKHGTAWPCRCVPACERVCMEWARSFRWRAAQCALAP